MRRITWSAGKDSEGEKSKTSEKRPVSLGPKLGPNLKSATLYPAERLSGFRLNERKKEKTTVPPDN
jgi:hypothetical protein